MKFIEKLRSLPESQKIVIFFVVMGIAALIAGFVGMRLMINDFSKVKDVGGSIKIPQIDLPQMSPQNNSN